MLLNEIADEIRREFDLDVEKRGYVLYIDMPVCLSLYAGDKELYIEQLTKRIYNRIMKKFQVFDLDIECNDLELKLRVLI